MDAACSESPPSASVMKTMLSERETLLIVNCGSVGNKARDTGKGNFT